jgi:hypothetical protein
LSNGLTPETLLGDTITNSIRDIELTDDSEVTYNAASFNPIGGGIGGGTPVIVPNFLPEPEPQVHQDLKKGKARWMKILGGGQKKPMDSMTKVSQYGAKKASATAATTAATGLMQHSMKTNVVGLAMEIVGLGMAIQARTDIVELEAWQQTNEKAINLYEQENGNLQRLLGKYGKNLDAAEQSIDNLANEVENVKQDNTQLKQSITTQQVSIDILKDNLEQSQQNQQQLKADLQTTKNNLTQLKEDAEGAITALEADVSELEQNLVISEENVERMQDVAYKQENRIFRLEGNQIELEDKFFNFTVYQSVVRAELNELIVDLQQENNLQDAISKGLTARLTILEARGGGGGGGISPYISESIADTQNKTLGLMQKLGTVKDSINYPDLGGIEDSIFEPITSDDISQGNVLKFEYTYDQLLDGIKPIGEPQVTKEELDTWGEGLRSSLNSDFNTSIATARDELMGGFDTSLNEKADIITTTVDASLTNTQGGIKSDTEAIVGTAIATMIIPGLTTVGNQVSAVGTQVGTIADRTEFIADRTNTVVNQTTPSAISSASSDAICQQAQNPTSCSNKQFNNFRNGMRADLNTGLNGLNGVLNGLLMAQGKQILEIVKNTNEVVTKGWKSTLVDKTLNAVGTALAFHNAVMLSRNLGVTLGETSTALSKLLKVNNSEGKEIDVNEWFNLKFTGLMKKIFTEEGYTALGRIVNAANRIMVAGQGIVSAVHGIKDSIQEGQEIISNRLASFSNAFLEQGVLEPGSFDWMTDEIPLKKTFPGFTRSVQNLTEFVEEVNELIESGIEVQESVNEVFENAEGALTASAELDKAFKDYIKQRNEQEDVKNNDSKSPDITNDDLIRDETEVVVEDVP